MEAKEAKTGLLLDAIVLRKLIGWLGVALPVLCAIYSLIRSTEILPSISDYYYTQINSIFVGILCILGASLFSYHGYMKAEDGLAKLGGLCAVGVAVCPTENSLPTPNPFIVIDYFGEKINAYPVLHGVFACGLFLIFMIFSAVFFTRTSMSDAEDPLTWRRAIMTLLVTVFVFRANPNFDPKLNPGKNRRNVIYRVCARLIAYSIIAVLVVALLRAVGLIHADPFRQFIFACETAALWAFAASWLTKAEQFAIVRDI